MLISHTLKIIFIHAQRTGGTTFTNTLRTTIAGYWDVFVQHGNARTTEAINLEKYGYYYSFGFTRNPWDRMLSWYSLLHTDDPRSLEEERKRLESFIENDAAVVTAEDYFHYNTLDYFSNTKGDLLVNKIFRFENLEVEIRELFKKLELPIPEIANINKTTTKNYKDYYTDKSRNLIAQKCKKDIQYFNYAF